MKPNQSPATEELNRTLLRPKVALIAWRGDIGGAETQSHLLAREFRAGGIDASIVFVEEGGPLVQRLERDHIPWRALGFSRGVAVLGRPHNILETLGTDGPDGVVLPDVGFLVALLRSGGYRAPVIGVDHGSLLQLPHISLVRRLRLRGTRTMASKFKYEHVVVSGAMRDEVLRHRSRNRCTLIYNGVDLPKLWSPPTVHPGESLIIGATGRLTVGKGFEYVIRAIAGQPVTLRIAGDGPDRLRLEAIAIDAGVDAQVDFLGWVHDVSSFWQNCHIGIMPSINDESFGLAAIEAMAASRPVIASYQPALLETIGASGLIVPPADASAIADAIALIAKEPDLLKQLAVKARKRVEQSFDIRVTARAYAKLLGLQLSSGEARPQTV